MARDDTLAQELAGLVGEQVVLDTKGPFLYIGTLERVECGTVLLSEVDVHDLRESSSSADLYLIETLKHGVRTNRKSVYVLTREIVSISRLTDIVPY